jgi:6-phosphogluconolactonase
LVDLRIFDSPEQAQAAAAALLAGAARAGEHIALCGGGTPAPAYEQAAELEPNWASATLWWGDERCVPPDDERSNYLLVENALLARVERRPGVVQRILGELDPEAAADDYDRKLEGITLGLALQGLGDDGHTASLFPNAPELDERERRAVAVSREDVPRVTMTLPVLRGAARVVFLVVGAAKADAVARAFAAPPGPATPGSLVRSTGGETIALLDRAAAANLDNVA